MMLLKPRGLAKFMFAVIVFSAMTAYARPPRVLKFQGVPLAQGQALRKKFPFVFEREVSMAEVLVITRLLM
jgi:hypothetical protein